MPEYHLRFRDKKRAPIDLLAACHEEARLAGEQIAPVLDVTRVLPSRDRPAHGYQPVSRRLAATLSKRDVERSGNANAR